MRCLGSWLWVIVAGSTTTLAGCSDNGGGTATDAGPEVGPDAIGDAGDAPVFVPNEGEPNDNDSPRDITLPATILGQINEPAVHPDFGAIPDADFFRFTAEAGTVVRLTLGAHTIDPDISVEAEDPGATAAIYRRLAPDAPGLTRQLFIPETGSYVLIVADWRNLETGEPVGGDSFTYELTIATETVTPESVSLPLVRTGESIPAGNGVRILELSVAEDGLLVADTNAADTGTDLDTALVLMNDDLSELVAENDDEDRSRGLYDAALREEIAAGSYHLVVDHYAATGPNATYDLSVRVSDPTVEVEPTNGPDNAWALPIAAGDDEPLVVTGTIEAPRSVGDGDIPDVDWFDLGMPAPGATIVLTVSAPEGSDLQPTFEAGSEDPFFGDVFTRSLTDGAGTARLEMTVVGVGGQPYYAIVEDARNVVPDDAPDDFVLEAVGGPTYTYEITAQAFTRTQTDLGSTPVSSAGQTLEPTGHVAWYAFTAAGSGQLAVTVENANFEPSLWLLESSPEANPEDVGFLLELGNERIEVEATAGTVFQVAVFNEGAWPVGEAATFDLTAAISE